MMMILSFVYVNKVHSEPLKKSRKKIIKIYIDGKRLTCSKIIISECEQEDILVE